MARPPAGGTRLASAGPVASRLSWIGAGLFAAGAARADMAYPKLAPPDDGPAWIEACAARLERARALLGDADRRFRSARVIVQRATLGGRALLEPTDRVTLRVAGAPGASFEARIERGVGGAGGGGWQGYDGGTSAFLWRSHGEREGRIEVAKASPDEGRLFLDLARAAVEQCLAPELRARRTP